MDKNEILKKIAEIAARYLSPDYRLFLFGSWAKGNALPESDLDVGILGNAPVPWEIMVNILQEVEAIPTLRKIDLVDLCSVEKDFRESVLLGAKELAEVRI